jgi:hypothetical protein
MGVSAGDGEKSSITPTPTLTKLHNITYARMYIEKKRMKSITRSERAERARAASYIHTSDNDSP